MKIEGQNTGHIEKPDDARSKETTDKAEEKDAFKKLLDKKTRKKGANEANTGKTDKTGKKSLGKSPGKAGERLAGKTKGKVSSRQKPGQQGKFSESLKGGELQVSRQAERSERHGTELHTERHHNETRLEDRHRKKHHRQVRSEHSQKSEQSRRQETPGEPSAKSALAGPKRRPGVATKAAERLAQAGEIGETGRAETGRAEMGRAGATSTEKAASSERAEKRAQVAELARKLVDKAHVGKDASGRQIMLLDLEVPGRGNVRVRLRRRGDGFELRMRPENEDLARDLRRDREHFRQSAAEKGVAFTSIEIA